MLLRTCLVSISLVALAASAMAQVPELQPEDVLKRLRSAEIVSDQAGLLVIRGFWDNADGTSSTGEIKCWRVLCPPVMRGPPVT